MSHLPNPVLFPAVIRREQVLEEESDNTFLTKVLVSHSKSHYELGEVIKKTIFGSVVHGVILEAVPGRSGVFQRTSQDVAIKVFDKQLVLHNLSRSREQPLNEMSILQYLGNHHPHIMGQIECCADDKNMYSIMPWAEGGELFDYIADHGAMTEAEAKPMFYRLLLAILRMHEMQVSHRDISLENIMYNPQDGTTQVIDFGMALPMFHRHHDHNTRGLADTTNDMCGKLNYMPPEVVQGEKRIDPYSGDVWSAGVVLFYVLLGFPPMERAHRSDQRFALLMDGEWNALLQHWRVQLSDDVLSLIQSMLTEDAGRRPTLEQLLQHPWLVSEHREYMRRLSVSSSSSSSIPANASQLNNRNSNNSVFFSNHNNNNNSKHTSPADFASVLYSHNSNNSSSSAAALTASNSNSMKMQLRQLSRKEAANIQSMGSIMHASG